MFVVFYCALWFVQMRQSRRSWSASTLWNRNCPCCDCCVKRTTSFHINRIRSYIFWRHIITSSNHSHIMFTVGCVILHDFCMASDCVCTIETHTVFFFTWSVEIMSWVFEGCLWNFFLSLLSSMSLTFYTGPAPLLRFLAHCSTRGFRSLELPGKYTSYRRFAGHFAGTSLSELRWGGWGTSPCEGSWIWCTAK